MLGKKIRFSESEMEGLMVRCFFIYALWCAATQTAKLLLYLISLI